ncbi:NUDIX domain-containing protein [Streptomyces sp. NBC_01803]|uniref:NUDIX domain-containing protein n=1 Tax=Streptomyces sp. NBC_01803 TaxID=2975946 RepID=UPI002DD95E6F|nr:NUDIX domain-containing protein [Streptomyces sp. NBC_01803]WSA44329.1 NUDIX domain-containing protein [Streptomyces sp. NBC_01803]
MPSTPSPLPPATAAMTLLVAAVVVHDRETDRIVLLQRGPEAKFGRGLWDLPVGKSDLGEPVTVTAVRELKEETGLIVDPADLRLAHVIHAAHGVESPDGFLTVVFLTHRWSGTLINAEPHKHSRVAWVSTDEIPGEIVFSADRVIERCLGGGEPGITLHGWP